MRGRECQQGGGGRNEKTGKKTGGRGLQWKKGGGGTLKGGFGRNKDKRTKEGYNPMWGGI